MITSTQPTALTAHHPVATEPEGDVLPLVSTEEKDPKPTVGMGCTRNSYTDRHAATVIHVSPSGRRITVRKDTATLLNTPKSGAPDALEYSPGGFAGHMSGEQRWEHRPDPKGITAVYTLRDLGDGRTIWKQVGWRTRSPGGTLTLGRRAHHYDYNF